MIYGIDLDVSRPVVGVMSDEEAKLEMEFFKAKTPEDLSDYDRKMFRKEKDAEAYLKKYMSALKSLKNLHLKADPTLPKILYKRRYIVQTILGEKLQTYRHYNKGWKPGQLFQLYDQTYFLTVKLVSIENTQNGYCYKFKHPNT